MTVSGELARQAREMAFEDLPPAVVHEAKRRVHGGAVVWLDLVSIRSGR